MDDDGKQENRKHIEMFQRPPFKQAVPPASGTNLRFEKIIPPISFTIYEKKATNSSVEFPALLLLSKRSFLERRVENSYIALLVSGFVSLKVFDILGREIATLVNEKREAGSYSVLWNAENMPGGVYFYRIEAGQFVQTKKLILLR